VYRSVVYIDIVYIDIVYSSVVYIDIVYKDIDIVYRSHMECTCTFTNYTYRLYLYKTYR